MVVVRAAGLTGVAADAPRLGRQDEVNSLDESLNKPLGAYAVVVMARLGHALFDLLGFATRDEAMRQAEIRLKRYRRENSRDPGWHVDVVATRPVSRFRLVDGEITVEDLSDG